MSRERYDPKKSWSRNAQAELDFVNDTMAEATKKLVGLIDSPLKDLPGLAVRRNDQILPVPSSEQFERAEVNFEISREEVGLAPEEIQMLFKDLGITLGDTLSMQLFVGRSPRAGHVSRLTFIPQKSDRNKYGMTIESNGGCLILQSGTSAANVKPVLNDDRVWKLEEVYHRLSSGLTSGMHEIGTHASIEEYEHVPHPFLAIIQKAAADWVISLIESREK